MPEHVHRRAVADRNLEPLHARQVDHRDDAAAGVRVPEQPDLDSTGAPVGQLANIGLSVDGHHAVKHRAPADVWHRGYPDTVRLDTGSRVRESAPMASTDATTST